MPSAPWWRRRIPATSTRSSSAASSANAAARWWASIWPDSGSRWTNRATTCLRKLVTSWIFFRFETSQRFRRRLVGLTEAVARVRDRERAILLRRHLEIVGRSIVLRRRRGRLALRWSRERRHRHG